MPTSILGSECVEGVCDGFGEKRLGIGEGTPVCHLGGELPEPRGRTRVPECRTGNDCQFERVRLQIPPEGVVTGHPADSLVLAERTDHLDGGVGGFGPSQQVKPTGDQHVGSKDSEVSGVFRARYPRFVSREFTCESQSVVDELHASGTVGHRVEQRAVVDIGAGPRIERPGGEYRQNTRSHRPLTELHLDAVVKFGGVDILDGIQRGATDCRGFLHYPYLAAGKPKTFGNAELPPAMIRSTVEGNVRVLTLDRPERRNALTRAGLDALEAAIEEATEPVLMLHGSGEAFCAGADLDVVAGLDSEGAADFARRGQEVATALAEYDGAVVAGIDGAARGGGVELALACDIRVATPTATLAETGVALGLFGAWGGTARLPAIVGDGEALDLSLSGRTVDAEEAHRMGLVSRIVDDPLAVAAEIAANDPGAIRVLKERIRDDADTTSQEDQEATAFAELVETFESDRNG